MSILELKKRIEQLSSEKKELVRHFFAVQEQIGTVQPPSTMVPWIEKTFGSVDAVQSQKIIRVTNQFTFEGALFNALRAKRPIQAQEKTAYETVIKETEGDPFCNPLEQTGEDSFGRVQGKHSLTAANIAKYDGLHAVVMFKKHNPLQWTEKELIDYFSTAKAWFEKAHDNNKRAVYPFVLWNCLWKSGASIVHGHMQTLLGKETHYSYIEYLNDVQYRYYREFGTNYFDDYFLAHKQLGLGKTYGKIKVLAHLVPKKEKEVLLISPTFDTKLFSAIHKVLTVLTKKLGVRTFNLGIYMPPLSLKGIMSTLHDAKAVPGWEGFPYVVRIVDRGDLSSKTADIAGMELFTNTNVIATDPYMVRKYL